MSMDDYQPAITETTTTTEAEPPPVAAAAVPAAAADDPETRPQRGPRTMSDATRKLFQGLIEKHRATEAGESLEVDDLVPAVTTTEQPEAGAESTPAAASPPSAPAAKPEAAPAAPTAPAADIAARAIEQQRAAAAEAREKAITERETKLADREKALPSREVFIEKPGKTLIDLIKGWTGAEGDELKAAIEDAVSELTSEGLGYQMPEGLKDKIEQRKAVRVVKAHKTDFARQQEAIAKEREAAAQAQREIHAQAALSYALTQAKDTAGTAYKDKFPYLMTEENPHIIVWKVLQAQEAKEGGAPNWEAAAELAENFLKDQAAADYARRRHLLNPAPPAAPAKAVVTQGAGPQNRPSAQTQPKPTPTPPKPEEAAEPLSREERRRRSLDKMRSKETPAT